MVTSLANRINSEIVLIPLDSNSSTKYDTLLPMLCELTGLASSDIHVTAAKAPSNAEGRLRNGKHQNRHYELCVLLVSSNRIEGAVEQAKKHIDNQLRGYFNTIVFMIPDSSGKWTVSDIVTNNSGSVVSSITAVYPDANIHQANNVTFESNPVQNRCFSESDYPLQLIYYGAPGTGKSFQTNEIVKKYSDTIRVTFHPDSDYASFVGCYKPSMTRSTRVYDVRELIVKLDEIKHSGVPYPCQKFAARYWESLQNLDTNAIKDIVNTCGFTDSMTVEITKGVAVGQELSTDASAGKIVYAFSPQAFTKAYAEAWRKCPAYLAAQDEAARKAATQFLVIEEINRGNCAQIFGDLFQLLDRDAATGYSSYPVDPDADLARHLYDWFRGDYVYGDGTKSPDVLAGIDDATKAQKVGSADSDATWDDILSGRKLVLPPNLYIWATMNTSDQSLFPIDSAFKRRWEWEYVPITDAAKKWAIFANGKRFDWWAFLEKANEAIRKATQSEDKELGYFFIKPPAGSTDIPAKTFVDKVLFYLFGDAFKDDTPPLSLFPKKADDSTPWTLRDFRKYVLEDGSAKTKPNEENLAIWLEKIEIKALDAGSDASNPAPDGAEAEPTLDGAGAEPAPAPEPQQL